MNLIDFLEELSAQDVELWIEGGRLRYYGPKSALTPSLLNKLRKHKVEILHLLQKGTYVSKVYPLSYGQRSQWFLYQSAPESAAYNAAFTARIRRDVDAPALQCALQALIARHPSLRTTFTMRGVKQPVQKVHGYQEVCLEEIDASTWTEDELNKRVVEAYQRPFDLEQGPVLRVSLFSRTKHDDIIFLLVIHHIVCDGWSLWILIDELGMLYSVEETGNKASMTHLEFSYADYVYWQADMLAGPEGERLWTYWKKQLSGDLPALDLPTDRPRPAVQTFRGSSYPFKLQKELTQRIIAMAKEKGVTLYMTLLAAFQVLLHRYTGQEEIIVGSPTTGRTRREFSGIVGYFVNPVVLRADISENPSFDEFLSQVRTSVLGALKHQDYPFPFLVERLQPERDPSRSPIFQVMFVLQKPHRNSEIVEVLIGSETGACVNWGNLPVEPFQMAQQEGQFDLTLEMIESRESLFGVFKYNQDLFDSATIDRMFRCFEMLLEEVIANPEQRVSDVALLTHAERHQLVVKGNDTAAEYPKDKCIHELFEEQVEKAADSIALVYEDRLLTYKGLNEKANQLARVLRSKGVKADSVVGLMVERSIDGIIGIVAILKAGGAYLPISPEYPTGRKQLMLEDSAADLLLTKKPLVDSNKEILQTISPEDILLVDDETIYSGHGQNLDINNKPQNLAYVSYTSGTTDKPKGVMIEHRNVVNVLTWFGKTYKLKSGMHVLQLTDYVFDPSVEQIFGTLLHGATLYMSNRELIADREAFVQFVTKNEINMINFVPSALKALLCHDRRLKSLRVVISGGERIEESVKDKIIERGYTLYNHYGPTETTIDALTTRCSSDKVTLGKPISNVGCFIFDNNNNLVPVGVPGELYISGAGVGRGYLNNHELTEERFLENPLIKGDRMYRTGDLARWLPDGNIEFLGRIDHQVKIRGFRIEPGEIESELLKHDGINEAVVVAKEDENVGRYLCAYIVAEKDLTVFELRQYLSGELPNYMIPSYFVRLQKMPLSPNGKINMKALPEPDGSVKLGVEYVAPRNEIEKSLSNIWQETLNSKKIGVNDNFFEIGGNSLILLSIHRKIEELYPGELQLSEILEYPSVANLAELIEKRERTVIKESKRNKQLQNFFKAVEESNAQLQTQVSTSKATLSRAGVNSYYFQKAYKDDSQVVFVNNIMCTEVLFALDLVPFNVEMVSGLLSYSNVAPKFLNIAEQHHFGRDICSVSRCALGAAIENCLPSPDYITFTSYPCDSSSKMFYNLSHMYEKDWFLLDIPYNHDEESVAYLARQIENMVATMEKALNVKLDPQKLEDAIQYSNEAIEYLEKISEFSKNTPSPLSAVESMDDVSSCFLLGSPEMAGICKMRYEEAKEKVKSNDKSTTNAKPRVLWHGLRPFYSDEIFDYIENQCNIEIISEANIPAINVFSCGIMDFTKPYQSLARKSISISSSGSIERFLNDRNYDIVNGYSIDGVISFNQWGCRLLSIHQMIREAVSGRNVPFLEIDGDHIDGRNYSFAQIKTRIDAFSEILHARIK